MLNPVHDNTEIVVQGGREDTRDHGLSRRSRSVRPLTTSQAGKRLVHKIAEGKTSHDD